VTCISGPRPVRWRLHIDHLDNADGDVWALSFAGRYLTVRHVWVRGAARELATVFRGRRARQPRAFLTGVGMIWLSADKQRAQIR
jgi:hypothetical protein